MLKYFIIYPQNLKALFMRNLISCILSVFLLASSASAFEDTRTFMPANELNLQDDESFAGGITQEQFNAVIDRAIKIYEPIIKGFGGKLKFNRRWTDSTVNASANQSGSTWEVNMYGGLARRAEVTEDGFAMVVCHEIGHHIAGYPYVQGWAANEGQSDMHATGACASKLFSLNLELADSAYAELPANLKAKCDASHPEGGRDLCYRAIVAGKSLGDLLAALSNQTVNYDKPDKSVVRRTVNSHPAAQCRLDTYIAGALCGSSKWDYNLIPGKDMRQKEAQDEAYSHSCPVGAGARPKCWFAEVPSSKPLEAACPHKNPELCDLACASDPSQPWCKTE